MPVSKSRRKDKRSKKNRGPSLRRHEGGVVLDLTSVDDLPGYEKMSDLLLEFVEPYAPDCASLDDCNAVVGTAALAWNLALFPEEERQAFLDRMVAELGLTPLDYAAMYLIEELIHRKKRHFGEYNRLITDYRVRKRNGGIYLKVEYTEFHGFKNRSPESILPASFQETRPRKSSWWAI